MDKEIHIRNLVYKYISNQCNGHEQDELLRHLQTPAGKWVFDEVMTSEAGKIFTSEEKIEPAVSNRLLKRLQQHMLAEESADDQSPSFLRSIHPLWIALGIALAAALLFYLL